MEDRNMAHEEKTGIDPKVTNPDNEDYQPSEDKISKTETLTKKQQSRKKSPTQDKGSE